MRKVRGVRAPSCIVAKHSDGCWERMDMFMMQDPIEADRVEDNCKMQSGRARTES